VTTVAPSRVLPPPVQEKAFAWDALVKEHTAKTGELSAKLSFSLTNVTDNEVIINAVRTSCGCTVAKVPNLPWHIPAGSNGTFEIVADLRGKSGILSKTVTVDSSAGYRFLTVRVSIPAGPASSNALADRARNMQVAMADRQAVFRGDCATCHLHPGMGRRGEELYHAVCGVCHEAEHRASMVPNLRALGHPTDAEFWREVISKGKSNTLMPAFSVAEGGPLADDQVQSLVDYLAGPFQLSSRTNHQSALPTQ
jgi:mono/diheme cytochrome c family protein